MGISRKIGKLKKLGVLVSLLICVNLVVIQLYGINVPYWDDYAFISFVHDFSQLNKFEDIFAILFRPHNEHQIFTTKIVFLLYYWIFDEINFKIICFLGTAIILGIYYFLSRDLSRNNFIKLVIAALLFVPIFNLTNWAMVALGQNLVIFLGIASMYFLEKNSKIGVSLSIVFALLASFSMAHGLLVFIPPTIVAGLELINKKQFNVNILIWSAFGLVIWWIYFSVLPSGVSQDSSILNHALSHPLQLFSHYFVFCVSPLRDIMPNFKFLILVGLLINIYIIALFWKCYLKFFEMKFLLYCLLFIMGSMFLISLGRSHIDISQAARYRYSIMPLTFWIVLILISSRLFSEIIQSKHIMFAICTSAFIFYSSKLFVHMNLLSERKQELHEGVISYLLGDHTKLSYPKTRIKSAKMRMDLGIKENIYNCKEIIKKPPMLSQLEDGYLDSNDKVYFNTRVESNVNQIITIDGWYYVENSLNLEVLIQFRNRSKSYYFHSKKTDRPDAKIYLEKKHGKEIKSPISGFNLILPLIGDLPSGMYDIYIVVLNKRDRLKYRRATNTRVKL